MIGDGTWESPARPKYKVPEFHFFYNGKKITWSGGIRKHYCFPERWVELTLPDDMGKALLQKYGVDVGGDVEYISDETPLEAYLLILKAEESVLEALKKRAEEQVRFWEPEKEKEVVE